MILCNYVHYSYIIMTAFIHPHILLNGRKACVCAALIPVIVARKFLISAPVAKFCTDKH